MENHTTPHPAAALNAAIDAARLADPMIVGNDGREHILVPENYNVIDVSDPHRIPEHVKAQLTVDDLASMTNYVNRFRSDNSLIFADYDDGKITAVLDWHRQSDDNAPANRDHASHRVTLKLRDSEEFSRWEKMEGEAHSQEEFAQFIEENISDVIDPDQGTLLEICKDLEVSQGSSFKSGTRLENGDRSFTYQSETQVKGEISVPTQIKLLIPLYFGEEPVEVMAKFRFRASQSGLFFTFVWHRVEYQRQAIFQQMAHKATEDTGLPSFLGRVPA